MVSLLEVMPNSAKKLHILSYKDVRGNTCTTRPQQIKLLYNKKSSYNNNIKCAFPTFALLCV